MRGVTSSATAFIMYLPASLARRILSALVASAVPLPGSAMPSDSSRQFMEFAVYMPQHEPQPGQHLFSISLSSSSDILPALTAPTASNIVDSDALRPFTTPDSMGPPDTTTVGRLTLHAPMSMPGTILSQLGTSTTPSKAWPMSMDSTLSAISSREGREYFIPACPIAMPSQTPMDGMTKGVPPAAYMPALTASATLSRCRCPGTISLFAEMTAMSGCRVLRPTYREPCKATAEALFRFPA